MSSPLLDALTGRQLYCVRRISDGFIQHQRSLSNTIPPNPPNPGPDQQFLPILVDDEPTFDPIYTLVDVVEAADIDPPISATQWLIKKTVKNRPQAEVLTLADNAERLETQKHLPSEDLAKITAVTLAAVIRQAKGLILTPDEQAATDRLVAIASKLNQNAATAADNRANILLGGKPDLKANWAEVSP